MKPILIVLGCYAVILFGIWAIIQIAESNRPTVTIREIEREVYTYENIND